jgi:hypothetical protein
VSPASAAAPGRLHELLRWYYVATPAFWALDWAGIPVRVAFLDGVPLGQNLYFALCCGIGIVAAVKPRYAAGLGLLESGASVALLIISVMVWYYQVVDWAGDAGAAVASPGPWHLANFVLAAAVAAVSFEARKLQLATHA